MSISYSPELSASNIKNYGILIGFSIQSQGHVISTEIHEENLASHRYRTEEETPCGSPQTSWECPGSSSFHTLKTTGV